MHPNAIFKIFFLLGVLSVLDLLRFLCFNFVFKVLEKVVNLCLSLIVLGFNLTFILTQLNIIPESLNSFNFKSLFPFPLRLLLDLHQKSLMHLNLFKFSVTD